MYKTLITFILLLSAALTQAQQVKVWAEPLVLPTYKVKAPEKNPMFFQNQSYQGASRYIYPYALEDNITNIKEDKTYNALYLENEYIKLCVLPEIGGRLFYATDKTNGYEIFYRQHVIKPANIGMTGAWISGGIEFCVFHHHRASTNIPVDYKLEQNNDGSSTIWIGETEPRHRMKWTLGISLYPGKSFIEVDGRLINPTENVNSILYWANVATHVNDDYQVIFPTSTDFAVYHAKNSFAHWPVTSETYNGKTHYQNNIDASWWKNHPDPVSFFAHEIDKGFLAGYDYGKNAGTMHVANHHIVKGAKLWEWGPGDYGTMWDSEVLTDDDGPYAELMTGAYSDNQPDYSWIKPYELKTFKQYWYPLRETNGAVAANLQATLNLKKTGNKEYIIAANTTEPFTNAIIRLQKNGKTVFEKSINISPDNPFSEKINSTVENEEDLKLIFSSEDGEELLTYQPIKKEQGLPLPDPVEPPKNPEEIESVEELYLTGLRIKQFHNARISPIPYFEEALKRDPLDVRSNTMMGILAKQDFKMDEAARYFRTALKRLTANYTRPRNCEPLYHLGVVLQQQQKLDAAYDTLYRAAWDLNFASAAYYHLAQISTKRNNLELALDEINRSLIYNNSNPAACNLKISLLRKLEQRSEALELIAQVMEKDPLNFRAMNEKVLLGEAEFSVLKNHLRDNPETYLELAVEYLNSGLSPEAKKLLLQAVNSVNGKLNKYPTIHYYLGQIYLDEGDKTKAHAHFRVAGNVPEDYCFPYRFETIDVYNTALELNPADSRAYYFLGNLLYDKQPERAIKNWIKAAQYDEEFAIAHRNVGWGYNHTYNDLETAISAYERAIKFNRTEPRFYYELDKLYEKAGTAIEQRKQLLTENHEYVSKRPDAFLQEIKVLAATGDYQQAIDYLLNNFFPRQEGVDNLHDIYVDACLGQGIDLLKEDLYEEALHYFTMADEYPKNHQIGRSPEYEKNAQVFLLQAQAKEKLNEQSSAKQLYKKVSDQQVNAPAFLFFKATALKETGENEAALKLAKEIEKRGNELISESAEVDFFSKFGEGESVQEREANGNYLLGLAALLEENNEKARHHFEQVINLNPAHFWGRIFVLNTSENGVKFLD